MQASNIESNTKQGSACFPGLDKNQVSKLELLGKKAEQKSYYAPRIWFCHAKAAKKLKCQLEEDVWLSVGR